jgi:glucokinase
VRFGYFEGVLRKGRGPNMNMNKTRRVFLAGDVGATKLDVKLLVVENGQVTPRPLVVTKLADLRAAGCNSFGGYLDQFVRLPLQTAGHEFSQLDGGLFDAAGQVANGIVEHEPYPNGCFDVAGGCTQVGIPRAELLNDGQAQAMALYRREVWDATTILHAGKDAILDRRDPTRMGFNGFGSGLAYTFNVNGVVIGSEGGNSRIAWIPQLANWCPASAGIYEWLEAKDDDDFCRWESLVSIAGLKVVAEFVTGRSLDTPQDVDQAVAQDPRVAQVFSFWAGVRAGTMVIDGPGLTGVALRGAHNMEVFEGQEDWFLLGLRATGVRGRTMAEHKGYMWYQVPDDTWYGLVAHAERQWAELFK